jgi:hypothetical protein
MQTADGGNGGSGAGGDASSILHPFEVVVHYASSCGSRNASI